MRNLVSLAVFSGLSMNLVLQFGLGIEAAAAQGEKQRFFPFQWAALTLTVLFFWLVFTYILSPLNLGSLEYALIFPLSALGCMGIEKLFPRIFPSQAREPVLFQSLSAYNGLAMTALFLSLRAASSFLEAAVMSLGFSLGTGLALVVLAGIRKRSLVEKLPPPLRGKALALISAGLLALIFSSISAILK